MTFYASAGAWLFLLLHSLFRILVGHNIKKVLNTKVYSLLLSGRCTPARMETKNVTYVGLILHALEVNVELR